LRAKRGTPILAPIVNGDGISTRPFDGCGVAHHDGAPLGHPHFVLSGRKDVSTRSRLRAKRGTPILAPIVNGDGLPIDTRRGT
jgi:hypothetical protein